MKKEQNMNKTRREIIARVKKDRKYFLETLETRKLTDI